MDAKTRFRSYQILTEQQNWYAPFPWRLLPETKMSLKELLAFWPKGEIASLLPPSRSIYIHIPFCRDRRCAFCIYGSHISRGTKGEDLYVDRIHRELTAWLPLMAEDGYTNLYVGGGTPSVLSPVTLKKLLFPFSRFRFQSEHENTCEMSPATASAEHLEVIRACGFNRVSFGVQSLDSTVLTNVNRAVVSESCIRSLIGIALRLGFEDINVDLMVGLPGQNPESVVADARKLASFGTKSMTIYRYLPGDGLSAKEEKRIFSNATECFPKIIEVLSKIGWHVTNGDATTAYLCLTSPNCPDKGLRYQTRPDGFHARCLFGFGAWANGFQGALQYRCFSGNLDFNETAQRYSVQFFSKMDQKRLAICTMLYARNLICDETFWKQSFGKTAEETFPEELAELDSLGLLAREDNAWRILAVTREEKSAAIKLFWDRRQLAKFFPEGLE